MLFLELPSCFVLLFFFIFFFIKKENTASQLGEAAQAGRQAGRAFPELELGFVFHFFFFKGRRRGRRREARRGKKEHKGRQGGERSVVATLTAEKPGRSEK